MLRGYISVTLDGYVADADGGVGFLDRFDGLDHGYDSFYSSIDTVIMGRTTYDQIIGFDVPWPYEGKRTIVVTSSKLGADAPKGVERWTGDLTGLSDISAHTRAWVVGGPKLQSAFLELGMIDQLDLFILPILLGAGTPLHRGKGPLPMNMVSARTLSMGVMHMIYTPASD